LTIPGNIPECRLSVWSGDHRRGDPRRAKCADSGRSRSRPL